MISASLHTCTNKQIFHLDKQYISLGKDMKMGLSTYAAFHYFTVVLINLILISNFIATYKIVSPSQVLS